jgi:WxcM-like, C-terminal
MILGKWIELPKITDPRGNLSFIESNNHVPFDIKRVYYLYDVPAGAARGGHAHKNLTQIAIALSGSFDFILDNGYEKERYSLNSPYKGLLINSGTWREMENFSSGSVCLVLASNFYTEDDYIRNYSDFLKEIKKV